MEQQQQQQLHQQPAEAVTVPQLSHSTIQTVRCFP
jgi:hypothetical protein